MIITDEIEEILEKEGWIVECISPLEIRNEVSNSFVTNKAAEAIIEEIVEQSKKEENNE